MQHAGSASGGILYRFVGRHVLDVLGVHGFLAVRRHEDFCCFVVIAVGTLVERTLRADQVYLLTGTPMTNRPRDLYNLLRCVGHPAARRKWAAVQWCSAMSIPIAIC